MTEITNAPELRFPEFKDEWIEKAFGDFTKTNQGLQIAISNRETQYKEGYYFYITNEFLKPNSKIKYYIKNPPNSVIANKDDILMTRTGNTGKVITGVHGAFHNNFFKIKFDNKQYDRLFIYELLKSSKINNKILSLAGTSTIPDLNHSDFYSIKSFIPKYEEQQKLGIFFSKLDRQIELEEEKLELLVQQKRGYMQKLFSQELRFKDKNGNQYPEWVTKKLGDIGKVAMNKRIYKNETTENGEIPFYKIGNFGKNADTFITREKFDEYKEKYPYPNVGDILISASGSIGRTIEYTGEDAYYQDSNIVWLNHNDEVINKYLKYFYKIVKWSGIEGTTIKRLYNKNILNTKIELPTVEEQYKMANFLSKLDKIIDIQIEKIELLKQRKQGLLQKMFI